MIAQVFIKENAFIDWEVLKHLFFLLAVQSATGKALNAFLTNSVCLNYLIINRA